MIIVIQFKLDKKRNRWQLDEIKYLSFQLMFALFQVMEMFLMV